MGGIPRATYRLQLNPEFDFAKASELLPYLAALGVSHVYCSPILQTVSGSTHGYDVVNPRRVNSELGGLGGWRSFVAAAHAAGLRIVLDIVPNHLAIDPSNPWWWDVLENGQASRYARMFDVDWTPPEPALRDTILMPILSDHYGRELDAGRIHLERDGASFMVTYFDHRLPVSPRSLEPVLTQAAQLARSDELAVLAESLGALPPSTVADPARREQRHRDKSVLLELVERLLDEQPDVAAAVDNVVHQVDADHDQLDDLLERQNYRLAFWRAAGRDLDYRRFFDVTTLIGTRLEDDEVYRETHDVILRWVRDGLVDGLRVDHPDGLRDPAEYFDRLRADAGARAWIVAEKILTDGEPLRRWPIQGTTGYDFMARVDGLFVDSAQERAMTAAYVDFTGYEPDLAATVRESKLLVLRDVLASELNRLTALGIRLLEHHRRHRDHTRHDVHEALRELAVAFPVYRSYVRADAGQIAPEDEQLIERAVEAAKSAGSDIPVDLIEFLGDVLMLRVQGRLESELTMRFQQLTGALMAKGVEDTAFYRYLRLVSLNEVGGNPSRYGIGVDEFHAANSAAQANWPATMLATSTHDTKRGEDVRARIHLLSQMPAEWARVVTSWSDHNERHRRGAVPDRNTEWLLYQTLVGVWPIDVDRLRAAMQKSVREAKLQTSWTRPDVEYEASLEHFARAILADATFTAELEALVHRLAPMAQATSMAMTLLKLTSPGVPDIYQGNELWQLNLVDPDNRRPVDFDERRRLFDALASATPEDALARSSDGLPKLWTIARALEVRKRVPAAFSGEATYEPLAVAGPCARNAIAFVRGGSVATVVPRLVLDVADGWSGTSVNVPAGRWRNAMTDERFVSGGGPTRLDSLLARFPVALLEREGD